MLIVCDADFSDWLIDNIQMNAYDPWWLIYFIDWLVVRKEDWERKEMKIFFFSFKEEEQLKIFFSTHFYRIVMHTTL